MKRWYKRALVVLYSVMMASGAWLCVPAQAQETPPPQQTQSVQQPTDSNAKKQSPEKTNHKRSDIELDSVIQIARPRSKVCTIQQQPTTISCVFAVTHAVGDSCTCKVGDRVREGRFLEP